MKGEYKLLLHCSMQQMWRLHHVQRLSVLWPTSFPSWQEFYPVCSLKESQIHPCCRSDISRVLCFFFCFFLWTCARTWERNDCISQNKFIPLVGKINIFHLQCLLSLWTSRLTLNVPQFPVQIWVKWGNLICRSLKHWQSSHMLSSTALPKFIPHLYFL